MEASDRPRPVLTVVDAAAIIVGIVIGGGIFRLPSLVAGNVAGPLPFILVWVAGGVISLVGALCYAELASTYPDAGGDYRYLQRAFGGDTAFLFAWARLMVIQTGSIAVQAFIIGDYATEIWPLGAYSSTFYAALVIVILTTVNVVGIRVGKDTQNALTAAVVIGLLVVVVAGAKQFGAVGMASAQGTTSGGGGALGLAMVFVLLTYGGWNEAAYLSAEMKGGRRSIVGALLLGIGAITVLYVLANLAYMLGLGLPQVAKANAIGADLMRMAFGKAGATIISLTIVAAVLSTLNGTILTGARTSYAMGRDYPLLGFLGRWEGRGSTPTNALLTQGAVALALVGSAVFLNKKFAAVGGFQAMVEYTAPVFWLFFLLAGMSLFILRDKDPMRERPFRVPLYPLTPILFCVVCGYMLYSSLMYAGRWAWIGAAVLVAGVPLLIVARWTMARETGEERGFPVEVAVRESGSE